MPNRKDKRVSKYESPRLQTYGKLQELTKGSVSGDQDGDGQLKVPTT
ncbi:MAG: hypothetical protein ACPGWR_10330 [Ardenticatenaceae bacterium]